MPGLHPYFQVYISVIVRKKAIHVGMVTNAHQHSFLLKHLCKT